MKPLAMCVAVLVAARPGWAVDLSSADDAAKAVVESAFAQAISDSRDAGAEPVIFTARADLNGDGAPEILGSVQSGYLCGGGGGCPIGIFVADGAGSFIYRTSVYADFIDVLDTVTNGFHDLSLASQTGTQTVAWTGNDYAPR